MKLFLKKVFLFTFYGILTTIIIFIIFLKFHTFLPSKKYFSNDFNNAFKNKNYNIITIGNSKMLSSINHKIIEEELHKSTINLGYSSSDISISKLILETYLNKSIQTPEIVILEVSWFTFNKDRTHFHPVSGELLLTDYHIYNSLFKYPNSRTNLFKSIKKEFKSFIFSTKQTDYSKKIKPKNNISEKSYQFNKEIFNKIFPDKKAGIDKILLEDFYSIIDLCIKHNIKLILYTAPEDEEYSDLQLDKNKIKSIYNTLAQKNRNVFYFDFTKGGNFYKKEYENWLKDSHHIYYKNKFTLELLKEVKILNILHN